MSTLPMLVIIQTDPNDILPFVKVMPVTSRKAGRRIYPNGTPFAFTKTSTLTIIGTDFLF
jgi:hypothetical protein